MAAALSMQDEVHANAASLHEKVRRGEYPITDSVLDDSFKILRQEFNDMNLFLSTLNSTEVSNAATMGFSGVHTTEEVSVSANGGVVTVIAPSWQKRKRLPKHPVAARLCKWQTDIMTIWLKAHEENPVADWKEIDYLCAETGLAPSQVSAWTTEAGRFLMTEKNRLRQQYARESLNRGHGLTLTGTVVNDVRQLPEESAEWNDNLVSDGCVEPGNSDCAEHVSVAYDLDAVDNLLVEDLIPIQEDVLLEDLDTVDIEILENLAEMWLEDEVSHGAEDLLGSAELFVEDDFLRPCKRARTMSFDVTKLVLSDMEEWANDFGISVDG